MSVEQLEAYIGSADIMGIKRLLAANPSLATAHTSYNVSPLMLACYFKKPQVVTLILEHLNDVDLFEASAAGKFDAVAYMVQKQPELVNDYAPDGFTPLGLACYFGHLDVAKYLISKGADVNLPADNNFRVAPIHSAVAGNFIAIAKLLIENGANVNVVQQAGSTPLHAAAQNGNLDMLILLLENGALVDARMEGGKLPADLAREKGFKEIADILS